MEWYEKWFNQDYLELYQDRDLNEARDQVEFLLGLKELGSWNKNNFCLDVACGAGRHVESLLKKGIKTFGVDLSRVLLNTAPESIKRRLAVADMRKIPVQSGKVSLVTSFFTSFGYFKTKADELLVLKEFRRVLGADGKLFMDLANLEPVVRDLVPEAVKEFEGGKAVIKKSIYKRDGETRVKKEIELNKSSGEKVIHSEDVHLFTLDEITMLLNQADLNIISTFGNFQGQAFSKDTPRLVVLAEGAC